MAPFGVVLTGRLPDEHVLALRGAPIVLLVVLGGYLAGLGDALAQPPPPASLQLAS